MKNEKQILKHIARVIIRVCAALALAYLLHPYVKDTMAEYEDVLVLGFFFSFIPQLILIALLLVMLRMVKFLFFSKHDAVWNHVTKISVQLTYLIILALFALSSYDTFGVWGAVLGLIFIELKEFILNGIDLPKEAKHEQ